MHIPSLEKFSIKWNFHSIFHPKEIPGIGCVLFGSLQARKWTVVTILYALLYTICRLFFTRRLKEFGPTFYFRDEVHAFRHIKIVLENMQHIISCEISVLFGRSKRKKCCLLNVLNSCCLGDVPH